MAKIKKLLAALLLCCMVGNLSGFASAYSESESAPETIPSTELQPSETGPKLVHSYDVSEYDVYLDLKKKDTKALLEDGYTRQEVSALQENKVEKELFARAQLSEVELRDFCYTAEQIEILKAYDGSPLEDNPQMRAVLATFTGSIYTESVYSSSATMIFNWSWSSIPIVCLPLVKDYAVCTFKGTNRNNIPVQMRLASSSCVVSYYNGSSYSYQESVSIADYDRFGYCKYNINQNDGSGKWAKIGSLTVQVREEATTGTLYSTMFDFTFAHTELAINGGVSVGKSGADWGVDIGFGVNELYHNDRTVHH